MLSVIFVHGTGVREKSYESSFAKISRELRKRFDIDATRCYWGGRYGAELHLKGDSIPKYQATRQHRGIGDAAEEEDNSVLLWDLLYRDPLYELGLLRPDGAVSRFVPGQPSPLESLDARLTALRSSGNVALLLDRGESASYFDEARASVAQSSAYQLAVAAPGTDAAALRGATARAIVAQLIAITRDRLDDDAALPTLVTSAHLRDELVAAIDVNLAGGTTERGIGALIGPPLQHLAAQAITPYLRRNRGAISDAAYPAAGDVLLYQVRGDAIRKYIADTVGDVRAKHGNDTRIVLLAHSLGGIASVDLLASDPVVSEAVALLVTVGSQAPLLYEIDALWSMRFEPPDALRSRLPDRFPNWLNVYDQRDILSYVAQAAFRRPVPDTNVPDRRWVEDVLVDNGQSFPTSHSAYWDNNVFWNVFTERVRRVAES